MKAPFAGQPPVPVQDLDFRPIGQAAVDPDVVWAKLAALSEGAAIASERYW